jgi:hypothetical protein
MPAMPLDPRQSQDRSAVVLQVMEQIARQLPSTFYFLPEDPYAELLN